MFALLLVLAIIYAVHKHNKEKRAVKRYNRRVKQSRRQNNKPVRRAGTQTTVETITTVNGIVVQHTLNGKPYAKTKAQQRQVPPPTTQRTHAELAPNNVDTMNPIMYEEYVANYLRNRGYLNVQRTKAAGDFGADVLATDRQGAKIAIQCKRYQNAVGYKAVQEIHAARTYYGCQRAWVVSTNGFTKNAKDGAARLRVELYVIR